MKGRKRHLLVDTQGFVLKVVVSAADVQDRDGARLVAHALRQYGPPLPRLQRVWADAAYGGALIEELRNQWGWRLRLSNAPTRSPPTLLPCNRIVGSWNVPSRGGGAAALEPRL